MQHLVHFILKPFLHIRYRVTIECHPDATKVEPPIILAANHHAYLDPLIIGTLLPDKLYYRAAPLRGVAGEKFFRNHFIGYLLLLVGGFPAKRSGFTAEDVLAPSLKQLRSGRSIVIFPEGKMVSKPGAAKAKPGCIYLSQLTGASIVPVLLSGFKRESGKSIFRRSEIKLYVYKPRKYSDLTPRMMKNKKLANALLQEIYSEKIL